MKDLCDLVTVRLEQKTIVSLGERMDSEIKTREGGFSAQLMSESDMIGQSSQETCRMLVQEKVFQITRN